MTVFENIKKEIVKCNSSMELIAFLDGFEACCLIYCNKNCKEEIYNNNVSIYGIE